MNRTDKFQEIRDIADSICNEDVTQEQISHLETLLTGNDEAQKFYAEYIGMHVHMMSPSEPTMEVIRRRVQVEEVIVRPVGSNNQSNTLSSEQSNAFSTNFSEKKVPTASIEGNDNIASKGHTTLVSDANINTKAKLKPKQTNTQLITFTLILLLIILTLLFLLLKTKDNYLGQIVNGSLTIDGSGQIDVNYLYAGEYIAEQPTQIQLTTGELLKLDKHTSIKLFNPTEIALNQGNLTIAEPQGNNISIFGPNFTMQSAGSNLTVRINGELASVTTGTQNILLPKRWRPQHYWSFDSHSDRAVDFAGNATGIPGKGASKVKGILGNGAFSFDNSKDARINVGSGGGTAPATGSFAVTDGVTIEALIMPKYSGDPTANSGRGELDEIFRKDQTDKNHRMLLSFQNDKGKNNLMPQGDFGESLSFGLYLVGQDYHELKLPLDGKNGRPTLADLKNNQAHHIVATYDVSSGLKAIYINGKMLAHYQYPAGSKMLSGGSGMANIGNSPNTLDNAAEAFSGIIDEVAFYNFSLPPFMIQQHFSYFQQGFNYFGLAANATTLPKQIYIQLPDNSTINLDPLTGLPEKINVNH